MDFDKIALMFYVPQYEEYFKRYAKDKSIKEYVDFTPWNCRLIFYGNELAGFLKVFTRNEEINDREISIALIPKYRGKGLATYMITTLVNNLFGDTSCEFVHMSIDKQNIASIKMALNCGFIENEELERELREDGDDRTLVFSIRNMNYGENRECLMKKRI